jgi:hypothetical protein
VASKSTREWLWVVLLGGWGTALPLFAHIPAVGDALRRHGVVLPPSWLVPIFGLALVLQLVYPLPFTGELVELVFGLALLFIAFWNAHAGSRASMGDASGAAATLGAWCLSLVIVVLLSGMSAHWSLRRAASVESIATAHAEVDALARDFTQVAAARGEAPTGCGLHKRLYTFVNEYDVGELAGLEFASLAVAGAPWNRIAYFLDPWNSPYWVRDHCGRKPGRRTVFVYSFGPNQRRDSLARGIGGDDIGTYLARPLRRGTRRQVMEDAAPRPGGAAQAGNRMTTGISRVVRRWYRS